MNEVSIIGVDLAKQVFQLHGATGEGEVVFRKSGDAVLRTDADRIEHASEMGTSELHSTSIMLAAIALTTDRACTRADLRRWLPNREADH